MRNLSVECRTWIIYYYSLPDVCLRRENPGQNAFPARAACSIAQQLRRAAAIHHNSASVTVPRQAATTSVDVIFRDIFQAIMSHTTVNTDFARQQMVAQQVRAFDVLDHRVLDLLSAMPREQFVPPGFESLAFADTEIPIGHGEYMMTPIVEGRILQALELHTSDTVLEVGTGSGFLTACLARLAGSVNSIDVHRDFLDAAEARLAGIDVSNCELGEMDATESLPDGKFDAIAVTGSIETIDTRYVSALKPGGRLFVVVGKKPVMEARLVVRTGIDDWQSSSLFETVLAPLQNGVNPPQFSF